MSTLGTAPSRRDREPLRFNRTPTNGNSLRAPRTRPTLSPTPSSRPDFFPRYRRYDWDRDWKTVMRVLAGWRSMIVEEIKPGMIRSAILLAAPREWAGGTRDQLDPDGISASTRRRSSLGSALSSASGPPSTAGPRADCRAPPCGCDRRRSPGTGPANRQADGDRSTASRARRSARRARGDDLRELNRTDGRTDERRTECHSRRWNRSISSRRPYCIGK